MALDVKSVGFSGDNTIELVKTLIRYDVPFLLLGKSSIGKSYSMIEMCNRFRIPHSILYIGSEKPSNIEGLPRLVGERSEKGDVLEFFKPNWFPNTKLINAYVSNGKKIFDSYVDNYFDGDSDLKIDKASVKSGRNFKGLHAILMGLFYFEWETPTTSEQAVQLAKVIDKKIDVDELESMPVLNEQPFTFKRELLTEEDMLKILTSDPDRVIRDDVRDMSLYLSTICGYGNFWLMLDELDKVDENEQDKYAPLLHIVRERIIKNFSFRELNEGKGAGVPNLVGVGSDYRTIKRKIDSAIDNGLPLVDGRIIGIANATANIEDALFRRFCHLVVENVMMVTKPPRALEEMRNCLSSVNENPKFKAINEMTDMLELKHISDVNLQWQFGFFPKMINKNDSQNNYIIQSLYKDLKKHGKKALTNKVTYLNTFVADATANMGGIPNALMKIIRDNFALEGDADNTIAFRSAIYRCLLEEILLEPAQRVMASMEEGEEPTAGVGTTTITDAKREFVMNKLQELAEKGLTPTQIAEGIDGDYQIEFSEVDSKEGNAQLKLGGLIAECSDFIRYTMMDEEGNFEQSEINKELTPRLIRTMYGGIMSKTLPADTKENLIEKVQNEFTQIVTASKADVEDIEFSDTASATAFSDLMLPTDGYMSSISSDVQRMYISDTYRYLYYQFNKKDDAELLKEKLPDAVRFIANQFKEVILDTYEKNSKRQVAHAMKTMKDEQLNKFRKAVQVNYMNFKLFMRTL